MSFKEYVDFANTNKTCYLPTVEGDQPRVLLPVWRTRVTIYGRHCAQAPFQRVHPVVWNRLGIGCRNVEEVPRGGGAAASEGSGSDDVVGVCINH